MRVQSRPSRQSCAARDVKGAMERVKVGRKKPGMRSRGTKERAVRTSAGTLTAGTQPCRNAHLGAGAGRRVRRWTSASVYCSSGGELWNFHRRGEGGSLAPARTFLRRRLDELLPPPTTTHPDPYFFATRLLTSSSRQLMCRSPAAARNSLAEDGRGQRYRQAARELAVVEPGPLWPR